MSDHVAVLRQPWGYLHRNLSGKYRVVAISDAATEFDYLKSDRTAVLQDGVYVHFGQPRQVELLESDADLLDLFFANGGFQGRKYELLSYITGNKLTGDATPYLAPATVLPESATHGIQKLEVQGRCFTNLPQQPTEYIIRPELEQELSRTLVDDRHPVITLVGRGGEIDRNSVESKRPSELIDYATATPFAIGFLETAFAIEDSSSGI